MLIIKWGCIAKRRTHRLLSNFSHVGGDANTMSIVLEEFLRGGCVDVLHEQRVLGRYLGSEILSHGIPYTSSQLYIRYHVSNRSKLTHAPKANEPPCCLQVVRAREASPRRLTRCNRCLEPQRYRYRRCRPHRVIVAVSLREWFKQSCAADGCGTNSALNRGRD